MIFPRGLATKWRPIAWYQKGSYEGPHAVDRVQGMGSDKEHHQWGQDVEGFKKLIEAEPARTHRAASGCHTP